MVTKLDFLHKQKGPNSAVAQLREHLDYLDDGSIRLDKKDRSAVLNYLATLDKVQALLQQLDHDKAADIRAELSLLDTVQKRFFGNGAAILRTLGGPESLRATRPETATPAENPWWYLDRHVAAKRAQQLRGLMKGAGILAVIVAILLVLFNTVLKPDPNVVAAKTHYETGFALLLQEGDTTGAIVEADRALSFRPEDFESLMLKGVALEMSMQANDAEEVYQMAAALAPGEEYVFLGRGRIYLQLGDAEKALSLAEEAIAINEEFAEAYFLAGQAHERLGDIQTAFAAMEKASELALEQENDTLYAIIRVNMGYLSNPGGGSGL